MLGNWIAYFGPHRLGWKRCVRRAEDIVGLQNVFRPGRGSVDERKIKLLWRRSAGARVSLSAGEFRGALMTKKRKKLHGTVQRVIKPAFSHEKEKAEIGIEEADELYRELRVENVLTDAEGNQVSLKQGAEVDVVVEADSDATLKKPDRDSAKK